MLLVLRYFELDEPVEIHFLKGEEKTAKVFAQDLYEQGHRPFLYSKTGTGKFRVIFNWNSRGRRTKKAA